MTDNGCHLFLGCIKPDGHGAFWYNNKVQLVHRVTWQMYIGPIPNGMLVLHKCRNANCCNVEHLYLGNQFDNMRDSIKDKTHFMSNVIYCPQGHEYNDDNTYRNPNTGHRGCKECRRQYVRNYKQRMKLKKLSCQPY